MSRVLTEPPSLPFIRSTSPSIPPFILWPLPFPFLISSLPIIKHPFHLPFHYPSLHIPFPFLLPLPCIPSPPPFTPHSPSPISLRFPKFSSSPFSLFPSNHPLPSLHSSLTPLPFPRSSHLLPSPLKPSTHHPPLPFLPLDIDSPHPSLPLTLHRPIPSSVTLPFLPLTLHKPIPSPITLAYLSFTLHYPITLPFRPLTLPQSTPSPFTLPSILTLFLISHSLTTPPALSPPPHPP